MPREAGRTTTDCTARRETTSTSTGPDMSQTANPASSVWSIGRWYPGQTWLKGIAETRHE